MKPSPPIESARSVAQAFSLVELLMVIAIIGILAVITVPAMSALMQSSDLTRGGQLVTDQVNLGRQTASAQNKVIELRFIQVPGRRGYAAAQLWRSDDNGDMTPSRRIVILPQSVTIADNSLSPGIAKLPAASMSLNGSNVTYRALQIRPSGEITPIAAMADLAFAVVPEVFAANSSLPANYFLVQINPVTGVPLAYRP
ncbi:MAG: hypothetical protein BGO12_08315 [Verrucomicrobia bacterium 61-8]|nr:Verru_Chthon cassette protein D [Verrucomicrobiota bacterium]OJV11780.1 MAG: hypothetical protein BGO12_08315 [Verrucomicrobia bacterium 61-8]